MKYQQSAASFAIVLMGLCLLLLFSFAFSVCIGIAGGNIRILADTILYPANASEIGKIMIDMRMPRALAACFTGASFALSGALMQGLTRNPLADVRLLGINSGAGFFVALSIVFLPAVSSIITILSELAGAAFAVILVYGFGAVKGKTESFRLILAGAAISALLTSMSQAVSLAFGIAKDLSFWSAGSLSGITWQNLSLILPFIVVAGVIGLALSGHLSVLALGEDSAVGLGINVRAVRVIGIIAVLLSAGASVSLVLLLLIAASVLLSVNSGYTKIPYSTVLQSLLYPDLGEASVVVVQFRLPRIVLSILCGIGLALAGCVMQTVTGNPLADPGILGINAGAGFAVMLFLIFFPALHIHTMVFQPIFAIAGGLCTTGILYLFAKRKRKLYPAYFLLGGVGFAALFSSFMLIMAADMDNSSYQIVARWLAGNIWGTSWYQVKAFLPYMLLLLPILFIRTNVLDILTLGEETALSLGVRVETERRLLLFAAVALTSVCVSVSGGIGFVGLVSPHIARRLVGGRHRMLMLVSMLFGALMLLLADTLGRPAFQPREIPVGIVISVLAAPYFLFLLRKRF